LTFHDSLRIQLYQWRLICIIAKKARPLEDSFWIA